MTAAKTKTNQQPGLVFSRPSRSSLFLLSFWHASVGFEISVSLLDTEGWGERKEQKTLDPVPRMHCHPVLRQLGELLCSGTRCPSADSLVLPRPLMPGNDSSSLASSREAPFHLLLLALMSVNSDISTNPPGFGGWRRVYPSHWKALLAPPTSRNHGGRLSSIDTQWHCKFTKDSSSFAFQLCHFYPSGALSWDLQVSLINAHPTGLTLLPQLLAAPCSSQAPNQHKKGGLIREVLPTPNFWTV